MSKARTRKMIVELLDGNCRECQQLGETPIGKSVLMVKAGTTDLPLCLAHAIQLSLDIRREVRKSYPSALNH